MREVYCFRGSFVKAGNSGGTVHIALRNFETYGFHDIDGHISEGNLSKAVPYRQAAEYFGIDKETLRSHGPGIISIDSLFNEMGVY